MNDRRKRVLLVDDDEDILESMRVALGECGYDILLARDGAEALMRAERDAPDLIVLDVVIPRRSGFVVLDRLRRGNRRNPPIIMTSANVDQRHQEFARSHGADAFLAKPFDLNDLVREVNTLLKA